MVPPDVTAVRFQFLKDLQALQQKVMDEIQADVIARPASARAPVRVDTAAEPRRARRAKSQGPLPPLDPEKHYSPKQTAPYLGIVLGTLREHMANPVDPDKPMKFNKKENGRVYFKGTEIKRLMEEPRYKVNHASGDLNAEA